MAYQDDDYGDESPHQRALRDQLRGPEDDDLTLTDQRVRTPEEQGLGPAIPGGSKTRTPAPTPAPASPAPQRAASLSRDEALKRVQSAYEQHLPNQLQEVESATDDVLRRATGYDAYGGDVERAVGDLVSQLQTRAGSQRTGGASLEATHAYTSSTPTAAPSGPDLSGLQQVMAQLQEDRAREQAERTSLREILMGQLGALQAPVSADAPGVREVLAGQRLGLQRSAEAQRREAAERRAYEGYGPNSPQFAQDAERIQQQAGEAEARGAGAVLLQELQGRRQTLQTLLSQALARGDSASARNIQAQLAAIQAQMQDAQFGANLGFQRDALDKNLGYQYDALGANVGLGTAGLNQRALEVLLGAV